MPWVSSRSNSTSRSRQPHRRVPQHSRRYRVRQITRRPACLTDASREVPSLQATSRKKLTTIRLKSARPISLLELATHECTWDEAALLESGAVVLLSGTGGQDRQADGMMVIEARSLANTYKEI